MIKNFIIKKLTGRHDEFKFDVSRTLAEFRQHIKESVQYTLLNSSRGCIYDNDNENSTVKYLIELLDRDILKDETITLHLSLNCLTPKRREGKRLIPCEHANEIVINPDTPSNLICPLNHDLIYYAVKINNQFYELDNISEYLTTQLKGPSNDSKLRCPLNTIISQDFTRNIILYHYDRDSKTFNELEVGTVKQYFLTKLRNRSLDQEEYNSLLLSHYQSKDMH